jgi:hypothetical protein
VSLCNLHYLARKPQFQIVDGDTVKIGPQLVRLFGIDAPEKGQACDDGNGTRAACQKGALRTALKATAVKTRRGAWRCPLHSGLSTGPKSAEGRARIAAAARARWAAYRAGKGEIAARDSQASI